MAISGSSTSKKTSTPARKTTSPPKKKVTTSKPPASKKTSTAGTAPKTAADSTAKKSNPSGIKDEKKAEEKAKTFKDGWKEDDKETVSGEAKKGSEESKKDDKPDSKGSPQELQKAEKDLERHNEKFENARQMAQRDADYDKSRNRGGGDLAPREKEYEELLRKTDRSEADNDKLKSLGDDLDGYYRRSGNKFTKLAQGRLDLEQQRDSLKPKTAETNASESFESQMQSLAKDRPEQLQSILQQAYPEATPEKRAELAKAAADGKLPMPQNVDFVSAESLNGALAGYNPENGGTVMLSESLRSNPAELSRAFAEETGHHFDTVMGKADSPGDEGRILQEGLEAGHQISADRLQQLRGQNDHGTATLNGRQVPVENRSAQQEQDLHRGAANQAVQILAQGTPEQRRELLAGYLSPGEMTESKNQPLRPLLREQMAQGNPSPEMRQAYENSMRAWESDARFRGGIPGYGEGLAAELNPQLQRGDTAEAERMLRGLRSGRDDHNYESQKRRTELASQLESRINQVKQDTQARSQRQDWMQKQQSNQNVGERTAQYRDALDPTQGQVRDPKLAEDVRRQLDSLGPEAPQELRDLRTQEIMQGRLRPGAAQGNGELPAEQRNGLADRIEQGNLSAEQTSALNQEFNQLSPADQAQVGREVAQRREQRIQNGEQLGNPQLTPQQQALLDQEYNRRGYQGGVDREFMKELSKKTAADQPSFADEVARRMQAGDRSAFVALRDAARTNPRAQQIMDHLKASEAEQQRYQEATQRIAEGKAWDGDMRTLQDVMEHRAGARDSVVSSMTDYISGHTSEQPSGYHREPVGRAALESFLQSQAREGYQNIDINARLNDAKLGQAHLDLMKTYGPMQSAGYERLQGALNAGGEHAQQVRDMLAGYEGTTYNASGFLERRGAYDALALLGSNKNASYDVSRGLANAGEQGAAAVQRQWEHLNDHGRVVAGTSLEDNKKLGELLKEGKMEGLDATVAQSLLQPVPEDHPNPTRQRLDALSAARTDASRDALTSLGGHPKLGQEALESLREDPAGHGAYFDALSSRDDAVRQNAMGGIHYIPDYKDWSDADKTAYLDHFSQGLNLTHDPKQRAEAVAKIKQRALSMDTPQSARVEAYGALMAGSNHLPEAERFQSQGLANEIAGVNFRGYGYNVNSGPVPDQSRLEELQRTGLMRDNGALVESVGASNSNELALADSQLRHSGQPGLVERFDQMRQADPSAYNDLLTSGTSRGFGMSTSGLGTFLEGKSKGDTGSAKELPADLKQRLGSHADTLAQAPNSPAGQMFADLQRQQEFKAKTDDLYRQRDQLAARGQDTRAVQQQIDQTVAAHEAGRYDNRGIEGRTQAVEQLGDRYGAVNSYADSLGLQGADYDRLLMQSAELQRMGNGAALDKMLELGAGPNGLKPGEVSLMMDMAQDMPTADFNRAIGGAADVNELRGNFDRMAMAEMSAYAGGGSDSLFGEAGRLDTRGERLTDYLVGRGKGGELFYPADGSHSVMGRMMSDGSPDSLAAARHLADSAISQSPRDSALGRTGKFFQEQLGGKPAGSGSLEAARLERDYYRNPNSQNASDRYLQQRLNADVRFGQSLAEMREPVLQGQDQRAAAARLDRLSERIKADQAGLPEGPAGAAASGRLANAQEALKLQKDKLESQYKQDELQRNQQMMLNGNMDHRAISGMLQNIVDSPGDSISLDFGVKAGVEIQAPLFGSAEAFVQVGAGAQMQMTEGGRVNVSFQARMGAGANAQAAGVAGASIEGEKYGRLTYSFANVDQASKFLAAQVYDVQDSLGLSPSGPRPTYVNPVTSTEGGVKFSGSAKFGPLEFQRDTQQATRELQQAKPWLAAEENTRAATAIETVNDTWTAGVGPVKLSLEAADQRGDANQVANGTTLTFRIQGSGSISSVTQARQDMVGTVMTAMDNMKPGWRDGLTDEQVKGKLMETFAGQQVKLTANGGAELTVATPYNLMLGQDGAMAHNAGSVFTDWISNQFSSNPEHIWRFHNARSFTETTLEGGLRARYGTGFVNGFVEGNFKFNYRDATTLAGGPWHARQMLYASRPGVPFDRAQLREMEKDGLLYQSGRDAGTLNPHALNYHLGRMRSDLQSMYANPDFRAENLRLPDGSIMDEKRYMNNIDTYLNEVARSMDVGLQQVGRPVEKFNELVNMGRIQEAQEILDRNGLRDADGNAVDQSDAESYRMYLEAINAIDQRSGWDTPWQLGEEYLQQKVPKPIRGFIR